VSVCTGCGGWIEHCPGARALVVVDHAALAERTPCHDDDPILRFSVSDRLGTRVALPSKYPEEIP